MSRRTPEDLIHPERIFFRLIDDYMEGRLSNRNSRPYYRAVVVDVDPDGGKLESNPPNPPGSIRARIYSSGLDATTPNGALTIFHPFFPEHMSPPVERDEHVLVQFEDPDGFSNGMWLTTVPVHREVNFGDPEEERQNPPTTANVFEGTNPGTSGGSDRDAEFGGLSEGDGVREEVISTFRSEAGSIFQNKRILHVGDSQVAGPYGREIGTLVRERGASFYLQDGRTSWGVIAWNEGTGPGLSRAPRVNQLINRHNPDIVLITLGGNDHFRIQRTVSGRNFYTNQVEQFYRNASRPNIQTIWISPPTAVGRSQRIQTGRNRVSEIIREVVGPMYVESRDLTNNTRGRAPDGVHFTRTGGRQWAEAIIQRLETQFR